MYGGAKDEGLNYKTSYTGTTRKFINLLQEFFQDFMGRGHYVTMDSAYMGDLMALIGREIWKCNILGTCQANRVGADITESQCGGVVRQQYRLDDVELPLSRLPRCGSRDAPT